jgi:uncharacterized protein with PQ loop repeat
MVLQLVGQLAQGLPLTAHEALSGVFGSISLASWIFLLVSPFTISRVTSDGYTGYPSKTSQYTNRPQVPQLIENYKQGSADGISLTFLAVWFIGDITNLAGALWAGLVPTVIALAIYFCFADLILIGQCLYYNVKNARKSRKTSTRSDDSIEQPLLGRRDSSNLGLPGSHRRRSSALSRRRRASSLPSLNEDGDDKGNQWLKNSLSIVGVCVVGAAGWAIAWKTGVWAPTPLRDDTSGDDVALGAQVLGYASALCYLGARIPQIIKNQKERSCEGLSLLFFMLSLLGNATYGAGVSCYLARCSCAMLTVARSSSTPSRRSISLPICRG